MNKKRGRFLILAGVLFLIALPLVLSLKTNTSSFDVDSTHTGSTGGEGSTGSYDSRSTLTYEQGGNKNASTISYTFNLGWFNVTVIAYALGNVTIHTVECSNDTSSYYPCEDMEYGMNITHIMVNCTAEYGSISEVRFNLYNLQDNFSYIDNAPYTYKNSDYYILNSSYLIQDSGDWNLTVTCVAQLTDTNTTLWNIPWGLLSAVIITPSNESEVQIHKYFTFQSKVTCVGGECGEVNITLDPERIGEFEAKKPKRGLFLNLANIIMTIIDYLGNRITGLLVYMEFPDNETCSGTLANETIIVCANVTKQICEDNCTEICNTTCENQTVQNCTNVTNELCIDNCTEVCDDINCTFNNETNTTECGQNCTQFCNPICENNTAENCTETIQQICADNCTQECYPFCFNQTLENCTEVIEQVCIIPQNITIKLQASSGEIGIVKLGSNVTIIKQELVVPEEGSELLGALSEGNFRFNTAILALELENESSAIVYLPKISDSEIVVVRKCDGWNFENDTCDSVWHDYPTALSQNGSYVWFSVDSFSAYAGGNYSANETGYLVIWDENDPGMPNASQNRTTGEQVKFFADYKSSYNGTKITDANCNISFIDNVDGGMVYNTTYTYYVYNRSFVNASTYTYTVNCVHDNYTDLITIDYIEIASGTQTKTGAVSTITGAVPFYTTDENPQNCSVLRAGDECTTTWTVNATGILGSIHTFFVIYNVLSNQVYVSDAETPHIELMISANDTQVPAILSTTLLPRIAYLGQNVSMYSTASDNVQIDKCWADIILPDLSMTKVSDTCTEQQSYTTTQLGEHTVSFTANDTSGNIEEKNDSFDVFNAFDFTLTANQSNGSVAAKLTMLHQPTGEMIYTANIFGEHTARVPDVIYDLIFKAFEERLQITLRNVNISEDNNKTFGMDKLSTPMSGYLAAYGADNNYSIANATVVVYYDDLSYSNETNLKLYKCEDWDFIGQNCAGSLVDITSEAVQDITEDYFSYTTTSLSGFAIKEAIPSPVVRPRRVVERRERVMHLAIEGYCKNQLTTMMATDDKGEPIGGVRVTVYKIDYVGLEGWIDTRYTDNNGVLKTVFTEEGNYKLYFTKDGYASTETSITIIDCFVCYDNNECAWDEHCIAGRCARLICEETEEIKDHKCIVKVRPPEVVNITEVPEVEIPALVEIIPLKELFIRFIRSLMRNYIFWIIVILIYIWIITKTAKRWFYKRRGFE